MGFILLSRLIQDTFSVENTWILPNIFDILSFSPRALNKSLSRREILWKRRNKHSEMLVFPRFAEFRAFLWREKCRYWIILPYFRFGGGGEGEANAHPHA